MPSTIKSKAGLQPDVLFLKPVEAIRLVPMLEKLRNGDVDQVDISDGTQILSIRRNGTESVRSKLTLTIADTTLAQNITVNIAGHTFIRFMHAMRDWGRSVAEYTLEVPTVLNYPTIRFKLAAGS